MIFFFPYINILIIVFNCDIADFKMTAPKTSRASAKGFDFDVPEPRQVRSADNYSGFQPCPTPRAGSSRPSLSFDLSGLSRGDQGAKEQLHSAPAARVPSVTSLAEYESPRIPVPAGSIVDTWSPG